MIRPKRKQPISRYSFSNNYPSVLLLGLVFMCGFAITMMHSLLAAAAYLGLWGFSYLVIYAGTCRFCAYYGKKCPIPLEGSCVDTFFPKNGTPFGHMQLYWATAAYGLRVILPVIFIFKYQITGWGIIYFSLLTLFWIIHLRFTGCPHCINARCPLNPDYRVHL